MILRVNFCFHAIFAFQNRLVGIRAKVRSTAEHTATSVLAVFIACERSGKNSNVLTALEETRVLLNVGVPAARFDALVPEALNRPALRHADDDSADVNDKLDGDDAPQEFWSRTTLSARRQQAQQQEGEGDATEAGRHDGKDLAQVHPLDGIHDTLRLGHEGSFVLPQTTIDGNGHEYTISNCKDLATDEPVSKYVPEEDGRRPTTHEGNEYYVVILEQIPHNSQANVKACADDGHREGCKDPGDDDDGRAKVA